MNLSEQLPKHQKYRDAYCPSDLYWGLGIENETYIELDTKALAAADCIIKNQNRERYSVDYWTIYKRNILDKTLKLWLDSLPYKGDTEITLPTLMNAHTFQRCDRYGEHKTTYTKNPSPNPKYCGTSLMDDLCKINSSIFKEGYDVWWTIDGDTIEFMTQNFYCAKMEHVIAEYKEYKNRWLRELQIALDTIKDKENVLCRRVKYPDKNYGVALFLTNRKNIAIFNNGTYHFNITLPTYLDKDAKIADWKRFVTSHSFVAKMFQWLSPFLVAKFGAGDIWGNLCNSKSFPVGSQRLCASRFVSVGTYDTDRMPTGKILTEPYVRKDGRWYERIYDHPDCVYQCLPAIGLDINFNKHWNHGLEFRIFDWFPESYLDEVFRLLIWMCDQALASLEVENPHKSIEWNELLANVVWNGSNVLLTYKQQIEFQTALGVEFGSITNVLDAYELIRTTWHKRWNESKGTCSHYMIASPLPPLDVPEPNKAYHPDPQKIFAASMKAFADGEHLPSTNKIDHNYAEIYNETIQIHNGVNEPINEYEIIAPNHMYVQENTSNHRVDTIVQDNTSPSQEPLQEHTLQHERILHNEPLPNSFVCTSITQNAILTSTKTQPIRTTTYSVMKRAIEWLSKIRHTMSCIK